MKLQILGVVAVSLVVPFVDTALAVEFTTKELLPFSGGKNCYAKAVNNYGVVVGQSDTPSGTYHACLWQGDQVIDLGTLGGQYSMASAINAQGQVVGKSVNSLGQWQGFVWTQATGMRPLATVPLYNWSEALTINNAGVIGGKGSETDHVLLPSNQAVVWDSQGNVHKLPQFATGRGGQVLEINDSGVMVGTCVTETGNWEHGVMWSNASAPIQDLGRGRTIGVNNQNNILLLPESTTGSSYSIGNPSIGFTDIDRPAGYTINLSSLNNSDQIVGRWYTSSTPEVAVFYDRVSGWQELPGFGGRDWAMDINDAGQIVGSSWNASYTFYHAFIMTPVPEPSVLVLLGMMAATGILCRLFRSTRSLVA